MSPFYRPEAQAEGPLALACLGNTKREACFGKTSRSLVPNEVGAVSLTLGRTKNGGSERKL